MAMKLTLFNVEHGFCAFIKTPTKFGLMIDCGCTENFSPALYVAHHELSDINTWNGFNLTRLTITHPHDDHIEDIDTVKEHCLTAKEAAVYLKIKPRTVLKWAKTGRIPAHPLSGEKRVTWRFLKSELDAMLALPSAAEDRRLH